MRGTGENRASVISVLWVNVALIISGFCLFSIYWTKMGLSCSPMCPKESCQSFLMRILFSLLSWLLSLSDFAVLPRKTTAQQSEGSAAGVLCFHRAQSHSETGLNRIMVCTLCMTPILHLYDLIVVKLMIFTDVDLDHLGFFRGGKLSLSHKPLAPIQSS